MEEVGEAIMMDAAFDVVNDQEHPDAADNEQIAKQIEKNEPAPKTIEEDKKQKNATPDTVADTVGKKTTMQIYMTHAQKV